MGARRSFPPQRGEALQQALTGNAGGAIKVAVPTNSVQALAIEDGERRARLLLPLKEDGGVLGAYLTDLFVQGWVAALHVRDLETSSHTRRVARATVALGRALGLNEATLRVWRWGALLHDIGKVAVPDNILHKPGPLTTQEWAVMRRHPLLAREMLEKAPFLPPEIVEIPLYHHERWDGSGYPFGLKGEGIPLAARAFAVVDVWDALLSERPYRLPWSRERVIRYMKVNAGVLFDPYLVDLYIRLWRRGLDG